MRIFFVLMLLVGLISCGSNKENPSIQDAKQTDSSAVDTTSIKTDTVSKIEQPILFENVPNTKDVADLLRYFREQYAVNYVEMPKEDTKVDVLDRFSCEKKYRLILQKRTTVKYGKVDNIYPIATISAYVYKDSTQCANAMNNWLNCFGNDCNQVQLKVDNTIKSTPGYYFINPTYIVCLEYKLEHQENNWEQMIKHLTRLFHQKKGYKIRVKPQGKLSWE